MNLRFTKRVSIPRHPLLSMPSLLIVPPLLIMLLISACAPTLQPSQSVVDIPEQFSNSGEDTLLDRWWTAFADQQLNTFIDLALTDNLGLRATWERLRQADSVARKAGAERSPTLNAEVEPAGLRTRSIVSPTSLSA